MITNIDVVIPVYNDEGHLKIVHDTIKKILENVPETNHHFIFINDGSKDKSWQTIEELHALDQRVKGISLSRNFGRHAALTAGLSYSQGDLVIMMDSDLQDNPEDIPRFLRKIQEGYDLVYGVRENRQDKFLKKATSALFEKIVNLLNNDPYPIHIATFRIATRRYVDEILKLREYDRFLGGLFSFVGFKQIGLPTKGRGSLRGRSNYNLRKLFSMAFSAVTSFSVFPLRITTYIGILISIFSFIIGGKMLIQKLFFNVAIKGYASLFVSLYFLFGILFVILGILGEYMGKIYLETKKRPLFIIEKTTESQK